MQTRRQLLFNTALAGLLRADDTPPNFPATNFPAKVKRVIYLFQSGAPSQMDLFDYKAKLTDLRGTELPDSIRMGQRDAGCAGLTSVRIRWIGIIRMCPSLL